MKEGLKKSDEDERRTTESWRIVELCGSGASPYRLDQGLDLSTVDLNGCPRYKARAL